jgi:hypothetical protein
MFVSSPRYGSGWTNGTGVTGGMAEGRVVGSSPALGAKRAGNLPAFGTCPDWKAELRGQIARAAEAHGARHFDWRAVGERQRELPRQGARPGPDGHSGAGNRFPQLQSRQL